MPQQFNFSLINLWCTKNLVDSQHFLGRLFDISLKTPDYTLNYFTDPFDKNADIVFVNTCGFISSWRDEAEQNVRKLLKAGKIVYLLGCAVQYYKQLQVSGSKLQVRNVHYLSRHDVTSVSLKDLMQWYNSTTFWNFEFSKGPRVYTNIEDKFEYLKIAEWCDNHCSFCIIPQLRWKQKSLAIEKILTEVKQMVDSWIEEIIVIAQDTTRYGTDLYGKPALLELLKKIDAMKWNFKYRLLYLYPDIVTLKQLQQLTKLKKFIPYFDVPLQHISSSVLKKMGRFYDEGYIRKFLDQIKKLFPVHFIRTNLIIWFPGETKEDFAQLKKFVQEEHFDNVALFEYHDEPLAASSKLPGKVPDKEIRRRFNEMKKIVESLRSTRAKMRKGKEEIGYIMDVERLRRWEIERLTIRPWLNCPEIDEYDKISVKQIIGCFDDSEELKIWDKIIYTI